MKKKISKLKQISSALKKSYKYFKDPKTSKWKKFLFLFPLIYIISPVDLVSDFVPLLGWLDDTAVALTVWKYLFDRLSAYDYNQEDGYTLDDDEYDIE